MLEYVLAFSAGIISFLSPCVLPLIPGYIAYVSGSTFNELLEKKEANFSCQHKYVDSTTILTVRKSNMSSKITTFTRDL